MKEYPKYKPSNIEWIGKIPEHWELKKLKYVAKNVQTGNTPPSENAEYYKDGDIDWFTPADFNDVLVLSDSKRKITDKALNDNVAKIYDSYSVLLVGIGATLGKIGIIEKKSSSNQQINAITFKINYNGYFGAYYLKSIANTIISLSNASTLAILNQSQTKEIIILVPPLPEQQSITHFLNDRTQKIDSLIEKKQKLIELLKEERTSTINQAVTRGLNPDAPMKDSGIEWLREIPKHWKIKRMKYVAEIKSSNVDKKSSDNEINVFLCNYLDVYKNEYIDNSFSFMEATANENEITKFIVKKGDVLVTKDSETPDDIANPAFIKEDLINTICGYHLAQIRANQIELIGEYLFRLFQSKKFNSHFEVSANGITRFGLSIDSFKLVLIPLPPIEEQNQIAKYIETSTQKIHRTISRIEKEITLLQEYRTSLFSEVVTGKIDVREAV